MVGAPVALVEGDIMQDYKVNAATLCVRVRAAREFPNEKL